MRLLCGIVAFTILCMVAVGVVVDHLADVCFVGSNSAPPARVHLISGVTQALQRAEEARRGYLATGDNAYLIAYRAAAADVDTTMDRMVTQDPEVATRLPQGEDLTNFVHERLTQIGNDMALSPPLKSGAPDTTTEPDMERVHKVMDALAQEERADIADELATVRARTVFHRNLAIALAAINGLFLAGAAACGAQIGKLYSLVTVCAWSKRVRYGDDWVPLEEFMWKRFGIRITHGISQQEYDKWSTEEPGGETPTAKDGAHNETPVVPKAAA